MKLAKYHRGDMYLPVDVYRRGSQEITLIGMIHVAPAEFYDRVRTLLEAHEERDDRILVEGMGRIEGDDFGLREFDRGLLKSYEELRDRSRMVSTLVAEATGMVTQLAAFPDWRQWERADLTALEMMRLRGVRPMPPMDEEIVGHLTAWLTSTRGRAASYWFIKSVPALLMAAWPIHSMLSQLVLHHRNRVAILKALETPRNAVLPWGAAHLPGMAKLLEQNGFSHAERTWNLALPGGGR